MRSSAFNWVWFDAGGCGCARSCLLWREAVKFTFFCNIWKTRCRRVPIKQSSTIKEDRRTKRVSGRSAAGPSEAEWKQLCARVCVSVFVCVCVLICYLVGTLSSQNLWSSGFFSKALSSCLFFAFLLRCDYGLGWTAGDLGFCFFKQMWSQ